MSDFTTTTESPNTHAGARSLDATRRVSSETKASFKTTELIAYVVVVVAVLVASAIVDKGNGFGAQEAWKYVTALTIGYMLSRGLAKSGSRNFHDDSNDSTNGR